jgi:CubicO group peptidase (beta-lactamase class C family)
MKNKTGLFVLLIGIFLASGCGPLTPTRTPLPAPAPALVEGLSVSTPETQGMDSVLLAQMLEEISASKTKIYSVIVLRHGKLVTEAYFHPYTRETKMHIQSVTKSVVGALVGKAVSRGALKGVDETLLDYFPNRMVANLGQAKEAIQIRHLLSMSSGLDCQEFSAAGPKMEQSSGWVQFMLDLPVVSQPGTKFGYCNGNVHLLSAILEKTTGQSAREYANQELFAPLGIPAAPEAEWGSDPQGYTLGGYGLHLRPVDLAKLALLYLNKGQWNGQQVLPAAWVEESTRPWIQKEDASDSAYGYMWTVYPGQEHYAALGLGGQQIHVYPAKDLAVVVTAGLEAYAEAPAIEKMLSQYILPAVKSEQSLKADESATLRLQNALWAAENPVIQPQELPKQAVAVSDSTYQFGENPYGWQNVRFVFKPGAPSAQLYFNGQALEVGLDNLYRLSKAQPFGELLLRGYWLAPDIFALDYPYPFNSPTRLGELGEAQIQFKFVRDEVEVKVLQMPFGGEPGVFKGARLK